MDFLNHRFPSYTCQLLILKIKGFVPRRVDTRDVPCQDNPQQQYSLTRYSG